MFFILLGFSSELPRAVERRPARFHSVVINIVVVSVYCYCSFVVVVVLVVVIIVVVGVLQLYQPRSLFNKNQVKKTKRRA